jgi:TRAP-type C4-dicarboxylate transport system permease small subunit
MRRALDTLYDAAGVLAAFFMIGTLLMVLASVFGRLLNFNLRGSDAYAGYCMAAASFLALAHTLRRGEHIRVTLLLQRYGARVTHAMEIWCHLAGTFLAGAFAFYSVRLAWQSKTFNDVSQGNDATPLWIPQVMMAAGTVVLAIAMIDSFVAHLRGTARRTGHEDELKLME